jgi:hypothetical protein
MGRAPQSGESKMDQVKRAQNLLKYAVEQFGRDRLYRVMFCGSTPVISAYDADETPIAEVWYQNDTLKIKYLYR